MRTTSRSTATLALLTFIAVIGLSSRIMAQSDVIAHGRTGFEIGGAYARVDGSNAASFGLSFSTNGRVDLGLIGSTVPRQSGHPAFTSYGAQIGLYFRKRSRSLNQWNFGLLMQFESGSATVTYGSYDKRSSSVNSAMVAPILFLNSGEPGKVIVQPRLMAGLAASNASKKGTKPMLGIGLACIVPRSSASIRFSMETHFIEDANSMHVGVSLILGRLIGDRRVNNDDFR